MELQLDNGKYQVVLKDSNLDVEITESAPLNLVVGENARIEVGEALNYIKSGQSEIEQVVSQGTEAFNQNALEKTNTFNQNATNKTNAFNLNATNKTDAFDLNASNKTTAFNNNATSKTNDFNTNATNKTTDFNTNASNKTNDFNSNYTEKKGLIDAQVLVAQGAATEAKQWAIGDPSEPTGNSAKYWAEQASSSLSGKQDLLTSANAGTGIEITGSGANVLISNTQTSATWGNITGTLSDQTDLQNALNAKSTVTLNDWSIN